MWISKIELTAFKSYQHQEFDFPKPADEQNIVLIGGLNGYGKTSILEALYLCLFGKDAISHLARAGLKSEEKGYPTFLEKAFNGEARRAGEDTMTAKVTISVSATKAYEVTRKWYFRSNGSWSGDEEATVRQLSRGVPDSPRADGKDNFFLSDLLDDVFVPAHVAPFFFFDGEEVKKLADQNRVEQVKQGLEGLLGVVLVRSLLQRLRTFEATQRSGASNAMDEAELQKTHQELEAIERQLNSAKESLKNKNARKAKLNGEFQSLLERITSIGGGGSSTATFRDLVEERAELRNRLRASRDQLESVIADKLPFQLVDREVRADLKSQLIAETKYLKWESEKRTLEPRKLEFEKAFHDVQEPKFDPALTESQIRAIEERLATAWTRLFYPPPNDCADGIKHGYLNEADRNALLTFLDQLSLSSQAISARLSEQVALQSEIDSLNRKIAKLEGVENDGTLASLRSELERTQNELNDLDTSIRDEDRQLIALEKNAHDLRANYEREKKKLDESLPARALIAKCERVRAVLDEVIPALFPLKVRALATAMTKVYRQLAHKDQVAKIEISDDGQTRILGKSGAEISFDRSAGENQIFATALIAGLAQVSGVKAPLVVDTPLGRLDSKHRENILQFWTSDKSRQVILLSQDEEISASFYKKIRPSVSKTYLLEHLEVGDGIGRTSAKENAYFGARG
jgi:DNA sulfur modification protein DndD